MHIHFPIFSTEDNSLLDIDGYITELCDISEDEQVSDEIEFTYYKDHRQENCTVYGNATVCLARDGNKYIVRDVYIDRIAVGTVGDRLDKDLIGILEAYIIDILKVQL